MNNFRLSLPGRASAWAALRLTTAALAALALSTLLGLDSPYWSAMTVLIVAQPTRGQLLGKSLARLAGTAVGALAAVALLHLSESSQLAFVIALALWVGGCALLANLLNGFHTYTAVLAGYTAALVALFGIHQPQSADLMAWSRLGTVLVGVLVSMLVSWLWIPPHTLGLRQRLQKVRAELQEVALQLLLQSTERQVREEECGRVLVELAQIDALCSQGSSGQSRTQRERRQSKRVVLALIDLLTATRALVDQLPARVVQAHRDAVELPALIIALEQCPELQQGEPQRRLRYLSEALVGLDIEWHRLDSNPALEPAYSTASTWEHRNWPDALRASIRVSSVLLLSGLTWVATGWPMLIMAMLGVSVLGSIFSTLPAPRQSILRALLGTTIGTVGAALYVVWIAPALPTLTLQILALIPFLLAGSLLIWQRKTAIVGTDFSMVFLLLSAPGMPLPEAARFLAIAPGPFLGAVVATAAFYLLLPTGPRQRYEDLKQAQFNELRQLATGRSILPEVLWRARLHQRSLKLLQCAPLARVPGAAACREQLQIFALASDLYALRHRLQSCNARVIQRFGDALHELSARPERLQQTLVSLHALQPAFAQRPELATLAAKVETQLGALLPGELSPPPAR